MPVSTASRAISMDHSGSTSHPGGQGDNAMNSFGPVNFPGAKNFFRKVERISRRDRCEIIRLLDAPEFKQVAAFVQPAMRRGRR